jgi:hypothetical protein
MKLGEANPFIPGLADTIDAVRESCAPAVDG